MKDLKLERLDVIHAGDATYPLADKMRAVSLTDWMAVARDGRGGTRKK